MVNGAARVNDGDTFIPCYEADIGDIVMVNMLQIDMFALVNINTLADFFQVECLFVIRAGVCVANQRKHQPCSGDHNDNFEDVGANGHRESDTDKIIK